MEDSEFDNGYDTGVEKADDNNFFVGDWEWDQWTPIGDDDDVPEPPTNDCYNGRQGLKPRVAA